MGMLLGHIVWFLVLLFVSERKMLTPKEIGARVVREHMQACDFRISGGCSVIQALIDEKEARAVTLVSQEGGGVG